MKSEVFRSAWARHNVRRRSHGSKRYRHPLVGELTVSYEAFTPPDEPDQSLVVYTTEPGSDSETALQLLANLTADTRRLRVEPQRPEPRALCSLSSPPGA